MLKGYIIRYKYCALGAIIAATCAAVCIFKLAHPDDREKMQRKI